MDDRDRIEKAFSLARAARGSTLPNPAVGAVVWDARGKVLAEAATSPSGRPHAERLALEKVGNRARGGTMAVTLEPCVAFPGKKSPPCAAAIILAGVERVVVGCEDPNPLVRGKGIHAMRRAGIRVEILDLEGRIEDFYAGFGRFLSAGRPRVTLKVAMSADGMASAGAGERTAITGDEARGFVHALRGVSDAVLVGANTVAIDDPHLDVRMASGPSPMPLVVAGSSPLPGERFLWSNPRSVVLGCGRPAGLPARVRFEALSGHGRVDLGALLDWCGKRGIHDLLVEPGPGLLEGFIASGAWDRLWVLRSPAPLGRGIPFDPRGLLPKTHPVRSIPLGGDVAELWTNPASVADVPSEGPSSGDDFPKG